MVPFVAYVFTLVTACSIYNGQDPKELRYDQSKMRIVNTPILTCSQKDAAIPSAVRRVPIQNTGRDVEEIYAYCVYADCMTNYGCYMAQYTQCAEWYHIDCIHVP